MADRAYSRRRVPEGNLAPETPPPRRDASPARPLGVAGAFEVIDLEHHPDGDLLRACAQATKLRDKLGADGGISSGNVRTADRDAYFRALDLITHTEALTHFGLQTKALFVMGDTLEPFEHSPAFLYASVIRDFLRMGVPA